MTLVPNIIIRLNIVRIKIKYKLMFRISLNYYTNILFKLLMTKIVGHRETNLVRLIY